MTTLLIDTAFEACQVALAKDETIFAQTTNTGGGGQDRILAGMVRDLLREQNITVKDLQKIAVTTGPGRFTGLRVGIAFARGLALVHRTPLVGINTMDIFARDLLQHYPNAENLVVLLSVKRGESFVRFVTPHMSEIIRVMDDALVATLTEKAAMTVGGFLSDAAKEILDGHVTLSDKAGAPSLANMALIARDMAPLPSEAVRPYYGA